MTTKNENCVVVESGSVDSQALCLDGDDDGGWTEQCPRCDRPIIAAYDGYFCEYCDHQWDENWEPWKCTPHEARRLPFRSIYYEDLHDMFQYAGCPGCAGLMNVDYGPMKDKGYMDAHEMVFTCRVCGAKAGYLELMDMKDKGELYVDCDRRNQGRRGR